MNENKAQKVIVYSQLCWMFCDRTKEFLSLNNISYTEHNVAEDESALEELKQLGYMTTPVTVINGTTIVGFNEDELMKTLGL